MATLADLHDAISRAASNGGGEKIFFYARNPTGAMRHGHVHVFDAAVCSVSFEGMQPQDALQVLASLDLIKVQSLGVRDAPHDKQFELPNGMALAMLDPAAAPAIATGRQAGNPVPAAAPQAPAPVETPQVRLTQIRLKERAIELLQPLYGNATTAKIASLEAKHPPSVRPAAFLMECESMAAVMLGRAKAQDLFAPLYEQLTD